MIGKTFGHLEQSSFLREIYSISYGNPPDVYLDNEKNNGEIILNLIKNNLLSSVHDISEGGLIIALSEMSLGSNLGVKILKPKKLTDLNQYFFGEDQGRYIVEVKKENLSQVEKLLVNNNIYFENIGYTQNNFFEIENELKIDINDLFKINNQWYNNY